MGSALEEKAYLLLTQITTVEPVREFRFHPVRKWRFDFAWPDKMIAVEVEGGSWSGGSHVNPIGFAKDCEKYNQATKMGWRVYRIVGKQIDQEYLEELLLEVS